MIQSFEKKNVVDSFWLIMVLYEYFDQLYSQRSPQSMIFHCKRQQNIGSLPSGLHFVSYLGGNYIMLERYTRFLKKNAPITHCGSGNLKTKTVENIFWVNIAYYSCWDFTKTIKWSHHNLMHCLAWLLACRLLFSADQKLKDDLSIKLQCIW